MIYNVIIFDFNQNKFIKYNIIPYLEKEYTKSENKPKTFKDFKKFILNKSEYKWSSRCEYEIILVDWPCKKSEEKWDVYKQIEINIDIITELFMKTYGSN